MLEEKGLHLFRTCRDRPAIELENERAREAGVSTRLSGEFMHFGDIWVVEGGKV